VTSSSDRLSSYAIWPMTDDGMGPSRAPGEEFLHLGEEGFRIGIAALRGFRFEGAQQFLLLLGELDRSLDAHLDEKIAVMAARFEQRHATSAQLELMAGLGAFGNRHGGARA